MALNWDNVATTTKKNTGLNWNKVNTSMANQQAFNIMNQATQQGTVQRYDGTSVQPMNQSNTTQNVISSQPTSVLKSYNVSNPMSKQINNNLKQ